MRRTEVEATQVREEGAVSRGPLVVAKLPSSSGRRGYGLEPVLLPGGEIARVSMTARDRDRLGSAAVRPNLGAVVAAFVASDFTM